MKGAYHTVRGYQLLEQNKKHITSSMEDYLEMIYRGSREDGYLRIGQLADLLNVRAPSASRMVQRLSELGLLRFKKYGIIMLNEDGEVIGEYLLERHRRLEKFLKILGCENEIIQQTELMEHCIDRELFLYIEIMCNFLMDHQDILKQYFDYKVKYRQQQKDSQELY